MSIEERAEVYLMETDHDDNHAIRNAYIAGATEQQAISEAELQKYKTLYEELESIQDPLEKRAILAEARIKELEEAVRDLLSTYEYEDQTEGENQACAKARKALNKPQQ